MRTVLVTGCSSGIGRATAKLFQQKGWNVSATIHPPEEEKELDKLSNVICPKLDVTKPETIKKAVEATIKKFGKIDVVVNNAGFAAVGPFECSTQKHMQNQFDVNTFGMMNVTREVLPHFRQNKAGVFVNVTSMASRMTLPLCTLYDSSKWAAEGFSECLHYELEPLGIAVKVVEPGVVRTKMYEGNMVLLENPRIHEYDDFIGRVLPGAKDPVLPRFLRLFGAKKKGSLPEETARVVYKAATDKGGRFRYIAGSDAKITLFLRKILSDGLFFRIVKRSMIKKPRR